MSVSENPAEETLYLQFGFRDAGVETENGSKYFLNCVSERRRSLEIIYYSQKEKHKKPSCVTVYKNSAQTNRLDSLERVCVSAGRESSRFWYQTSLTFSLI